MNRTVICVFAFKVSAFLASETVVFLKLTIAFIIVTEMMLNSYINRYKNICITNANICSQILQF